MVDDVPEVVKSDQPDEIGSVSKDDHTRKVHRERLRAASARHDTEIDTKPMRLRARDSSRAQASITPGGAIAARRSEWTVPGARVAWCQNDGVNLILLEPGEVDESGHATLSGPRAAHLRDVLRVERGRLVRVGVIDGPYGNATVSAVDDDAVTLSVVFEATTPARPPVDLLLALPRPKVMRRLWAQLAALGVGRIVLTNAERVERHYFDTHLLTVEQYRPLLVEGLQQARDTRVPLVSIHRQFKILVEDHLDHLCGAGRRLMADPASPTPLYGPRFGTGRVLLAIGPEGGWNDYERALLQAHGFEAVGMGSRTLRSDTACVALLTLAHGALTWSAVD